MPAFMATVVRNDIPLASSYTPTVGLMPSAEKWAWKSAWRSSARCSALVSADLHVQTVPFGVLCSVCSEDMAGGRWSAHLAVGAGH